MNAAGLIQEIDAFLSREDVRMAETTFGKTAVNDGKFIPELREGRRVWPETAEKVRAFIRDYKPESSVAAAPKASAA